MERKLGSGKCDMLRDASWHHREKFQRVMYRLWPGQNSECLTQSWHRLLRSTNPVVLQYSAPSVFR